MGLVRIINCLSPVNPEVNRMPESDSSLSCFLKLVGLIDMAVTALVYFNSEADTKHVAAAGIIGAALYLGGAVKDYLTLRKADNIDAYLEQHERDLRELPIWDYNQLYGPRGSKRHPQL